MLVNDSIHVKGKKKRTSREEEGKEEMSVEGKRTLQWSSILPSWPAMAMQNQIGKTLIIGDLFQ